MFEEETPDIGKCSAVVPLIRGKGQYGDGSDDNRRRCELSEVLRYDMGCSSQFLHFVSFVGSECVEGNRLG